LTYRDPPRFDYLARHRDSLVTGVLKNEGRDRYRRRGHESWRHRREFGDARGVREIDPGFLERLATRCIFERRIGWLTPATREREMPTPRITIDSRAPNKQ
jgi:hypothetical protein